MFVRKRVRGSVGVPSRVTAALLRRFCTFPSSRTDPGKLGVRVWTLASRMVVACKVWVMLYFAAHRRDRAFANAYTARPRSRAGPRAATERHRAPPVAVSWPRKWLKLELNLNFGADAVRGRDSRARFATQARFASAVRTSAVRKRLASAVRKRRAQASSRRCAARGPVLGGQRAPRYARPRRSRARSRARFASDSQAVRKHHVRDAACSGVRGRASTHRDWHAAARHRCGAARRGAPTLPRLPAVRERVSPACAAVKFLGARASGRRHRTQPAQRQALQRLAPDWRGACGRRFAHSSNE